MLIKILILLFLIFINGIFSASEMAYLNISKFELNKALKKNNKKAKKIVNILQDESAFLSTIQIAITFSGFLASAFAAESFAGELAEVIKISFLSKSALTSILVIVITLILSYFTLVFGELLPKKIGLCYPEKIAYMTIGLMTITKKIFKPFIAILTSSVDFVAKLFDIKEQKDDDEDEIKDTIVDSELEEFEKKLLINVFEFNDTTVEQVMTPADEVITIDIKESKDSVIKKIKTYKYTRIPILEDDKVIGILNMKDLIIKNSDSFDVKYYLRKVIKMESDTIIDDAFLLLRSKHEMMAIVEEKGKFKGVVTIEDIVEEVVGNMFDEYDEEEV